MTGLLALVPVALGLGTAALVQIGRRNERGKGLAVGGLVAAAFWAVAITGVVLVGVSGGFDDVREGNLADVASTTVGSCVNEDPPAVADCSTPHYLEVYYSAVLPEPHWRGRSTIDNEADDICYDAFSDYVGGSYDSSRYDYAYFTPSHQEWDAGKRAVVCVITPAGDYLTGSVKGTGR